MSEVSCFEVGQSYATHSVCDYDIIYSETITARTAKTVTTSKGKRFRVSVWNGVESFKPHGSYSMAAIISADKTLAEISNKYESYCRAGVSFRANLQNERKK